MTSKLNPPSTLHQHELMQMLSNAMDAMDRDDQAALKSFTNNTIILHEELTKSFTDATNCPDAPASKDELCHMLMIAATALLYAKTCVIPRVPARDLMRLQIELAGFTGSYPAPLSALSAPSAVKPPFFTNPESRN